MNTHPHCRGFSLLQVLIVIATVSVLAMFFLPTLARSSKCTTRNACASNLKQVGLAYRLWANDHGDQFPFSSTSEDGSLAWTNSPQVFRHFQVISNELVTPKVLVCRNDPSRTKTSDFTQLSNSNVSYFVGLDARDGEVGQILSGDRNITGGTLSNGFLRTLKPISQAGWSGEIHQHVGNIGLADGSVQQFTTGGLRQYLAAMTNTPSRLAIP